LLLFIYSKVVLRGFENTSVCRQISMQQKIPLFALRPEICRKTGTQINRQYHLNSTFYIW